MLNGVDASPLTANPSVAAFCVAGAAAGSQPAEPLSPEDTVTVMPSAAACSHKLFSNWFPVVPRAASQLPKLSLITAARLLSTMYRAERSMPSLAFDVGVSVTTSLIVALGATAPDHSTSRSASVSSPVETIPGAGPFSTTVGSIGVQTNIERQ